MKTRNYLSGFLKWFVLLSIMLIILVPIAWIFLSSMKSKVEIISYPPRFFPTVFTTDNFTTLFKKLPMFTYIQNSFVYVLLLMAFQITVDTLAGYAFARMEFKGKHVLFTITLASMMIPFQVIMIPLFLECSVMGIVNTYVGLVMPRIVNVTCLFMLRAYFVTLPKSLEEAGRIDGVTEFGIFLKIMIPQCVPILITHAVLSFSLGWNDLLWPLLMTSSKQNRMLANGLAGFVGSEVTQYGPAFAGAVISLIPALVLYLVGQKYFVNSVVSSGMKE